ncbi:hypothetical protein SELMODRAFT_416210 [Selaginella moellendorffii]|uniref:Protein kinase domain-containing protein n=1 Tax=Selaginella moellendorffii TaxID=88036 RepID=D8RYF5_SELML|nr:hypothetical protein SELMODRAFT_416210 [Selaginella moellendorffii]
MGTTWAPADFGFSKLIDKDKTHVVTVGYMAPSGSILVSRTRPTCSKTPPEIMGVCIKAVECSLDSDSQMDVVLLAQTAFNKLHNGNSVVYNQLLKAEDGFFEWLLSTSSRSGYDQEDPLQRPVVMKLLEGAMDVLAFPQLERPAAQASSLLMSSSASSGV